MSSASRSGSCNGASSALSVAMILFVRPKTSPAITSGDGLHPLSAPWCSSNEIACKLCSSA